MLTTTAAFNESPLLKIGNAYVRAAAILYVQEEDEGALTIRLTDCTTITAKKATLRDFEQTVIQGVGKVLG